MFSAAKIQTKYQDFALLFLFKKIFLPQKQDMREITAYLQDEMHIIIQLEIADTL